MRPPDKNKEGNEKGSTDVCKKMETWYVPLFSWKFIKIHDTCIFKPRRNPAVESPV